MHICFISNEYPLWASGGVGSFLQTFCRALLKHGHRASIVGIGKSQKREELNDDGVNIYRLPVSKLPVAKFIGNTNSINREIKRIHTEHKVDIVESAELEMLFIKKLSSIRYVIRLHGGHHFFAESENRDINWWKGFKEKQSFKKADAFIAVSEYVKVHTAKYLSYNNKPIEIISSPIDTNLFSPIHEVKIETNNITFVGTVCEKKGVRQLILAIGKLRSNFPDLQLHIYGKDWLFKDGSSYVKKLKTEYKSIVDNCVTFHGVVPFSDVSKKYAKAAICVFPSHMETQGLVAQEAMAMGKPVVFSELGPGPETIESYKTGLLCNPHNVDDVVEKITWYLKNQSEAESIGKAARAFVIQKFNLSTILDNNISFYNSIK